MNRDMNATHSHWMKMQSPIIRRKKHLDYAPETTSFRSRNQPVTVASPRTPERGGSVRCGARRMTNSRLRRETADEIARDGSGCFTGWAHHFSKPRTMRVTRGWQRCG